MTDHKIKLIFNITGERRQDIVCLLFILKKPNMFLIYSVKLSVQCTKPAGDGDDGFLETFIAPFHCRLYAWGKGHSIMFMESIVHMACFPLSSGKL